MRESFRRARRLACALSIAAALQVSAQAVEARPSLAGKYLAGPSHLELTGTGEFRHDGGDSCFRGGGDVGLPNESSGRYRRAGQWLSLEVLNGAHIDGCSIDLKLFVLRVGGHEVLLGESYLRFIVNQRRSGRPIDKIYPYHRVGEPAAFSQDPEAWLPPPYAALYRMPPPSGKVVEVGEVSTSTVFGSAGAVQGQRSHARLKVDMGPRHGAFKGMRVCAPGSPGSLALEAVEEGSAYVTWSWPLPDGTPPATGMPLTGYCP